MHSAKGELSTQQTLLCVYTSMGKNLDRLYREVSPVSISSEVMQLTVQKMSAFLGLGEREKKGKFHHFFSMPYSGKSWGICRMPSQLSG